MQAPSTKITELYASGVIERPRYFPRQLITPTDLTLEANYFRDRFRRLVRFLFGWGVVCGAVVCRVPQADGAGAQPWKVRLKPGYILGPFGDEIIVESERTIDLRTDGAVTTADAPAGEAVDPWCSDVQIPRKSGTLWIAVRYKEVMTRPVRVQPAGCSCDDTPCEYSRWCDGYEVGVLSNRPQSHAKAPQVTNAKAGALVDCPPSPTDPWVVLAEVDLDEQGNITRIDNCSWRRIVVSYANAWKQCDGPKLEIKKITGVDPSVELPPGKHIDDVTVIGAGFALNAGVDFGSGVQVQVNQPAIWDETQITMTVDILESASPGPRTLTITNPDCSMATLPNALTVSKSSAPAQPTPSAPAAVPRPSRRQAHPRGQEDKTGE